MGRRRTPRMPGLNVTHHTLAKIKRIGLRHRKSPPTGSKSHSHPRWNPQRFNLTVRCSLGRRDAVFVTAILGANYAPDGPDGEGEGESDTYSTSSIFDFGY